jgi:hypothetical protein
MVGSIYRMVIYSKVRMVKGLGDWLYLDHYNSINVPPSYETHLKINFGVEGTISIFYLKAPNNFEEVKFDKKYTEDELLELSVSVTGI